MIESNKGLTTRVAFIGYRDIKDSKRFEIIEFTENVHSVRGFISKLVATGGGDAPEDVAGGLDKALKLNWTENSVKSLFLILDAPTHGSDYHNYGNFGDDYPKGSPDGHVLEK